MKIKINKAQTLAGKFYSREKLLQLIADAAGVESSEIGIVADLTEDDEIEALEITFPEHAVVNSGKLTAALARADLPLSQSASAQLAEKNNEKAEFLSVERVRSLVNRIQELENRVSVLEQG